MSLKNLYSWNHKSNTAPASGCGSACGSGDKIAEAPSACGTKDKLLKPAAACGSACGSGDK